jgi:hypothetical protein
MEEPSNPKLDEDKERGVEFIEVKVQRGPERDGTGRSSLQQSHIGTDPKTLPEVFKRFHS